MQTLVILGNIRAAKALSDYLHQHKIESHIQKEEDGFHLMFDESSDIETAKRLITEFAENPNDDKFWTASWNRNEVEDLSSEQTQAEPIISKVWQQTGIFTRVLGGIILAIFIAQLAGYSRFLFLHLGFPENLTQLNFSEIYRLVTPALMHGDATHLVLNLFWWVWLAGQLEKIKGASWLLNASLFTALAAHLSQYFMVSSSFIGLSGVVYGLLGYAWLAGRLGRLPELKLPSGIIIMMLLWLVVGFAEVLNLRMANWAHLGGLLSGLLIALLEAKWSKKA